MADEEIEVQENLDLISDENNNASGHPGVGGDCYDPSAPSAISSTHSKYIGTPEDPRPAEERISELLDLMAFRRKILLNAIAYCETPQAVSDLNAFINKMQTDNTSVYSAETLCSLLERAGALKRITAEGDIASTVEGEPQTIVVDGVEYLEASEPVKSYWRATEEGMAAVDADKPLDRLRELFVQDKNYLPVYKRILTLCSAPDGSKIQTLSEEIDKQPIMKEPRLYVSHFIDKLEQCDALEWQKSWITNDIGFMGLELLAEVEDLSTLSEEEA